MSWLSIGKFDLIRDQIISVPATGEMFRISHESSESEKSDLRGIISQGFFDDTINVFNRKRLIYMSESEIFIFPLSLPIASMQLYFQRLDQSQNNWNIHVETYQSDNPLEDFVNYLKIRFGSEAINGLADAALIP